MRKQHTALGNLGALLLLLSVSSCMKTSEEAPSTGVARQTRAIIFGDDNRVDVHDIATLPFAENFERAAAATAVIVDDSDVDCSDSTSPCTLETGPATFNGLNLCSDQRFEDQAAFQPPSTDTDSRDCSAFLVAPNVMVTNGACFSGTSPGLSFVCNESRIVFGWNRSSPGVDVTEVPQENVYRCVSVLDMYGGERDDIPRFAVFTLDRNVVNSANEPVAPLPFRKKADGKMPDGLTTLGISGYPIGLPLKLADDISVTDNTNSNFFFATPDAGTGWSGSPVFDYETGLVEGIAVKAALPRFVIRPATGGEPECLEWRICDPSAGCDVNAEAIKITRISVIEDAVPKFDNGAADGAAGPGTKYNVYSNGARVRCTGTCANALVDSDGDSLPDEWETQGVDVQVDGETVHLDLPGMGADPNHKDLFLQIDWMHRLLPNDVHLGLGPDSMDLMRRSFEDAPVWNPDGEIGIRLHLDAGPGSKTWNGTEWVEWPDTPTAVCGEGCIRRAHETAHTKFFVESTCATSSCTDQRNESTARLQAIGAEAFVPAGRSNIFYYGVAADYLWRDFDGTEDHATQDPSPDLIYDATGTTITGGFITSLGFAFPQDDATQGWTAGGTVFERAVNSQHELGHSLGLMHYGGVVPGVSDPVCTPAPCILGSSRKPNYVSIMSYNLNFDGVTRSDGIAYIDYSRHQLPTLDEAGLDERLGISDPDSTHTKWRCPTGRYTTYEEPGSIMFDTFNEAIDWNCGGFGIDPPEAPESSVTTSIDGSNATVLTGWNDWQNLDWSAYFPGDAVLGDYIEEPTWAEIEETYPAALRLDRMEKPIPRLTVSDNLGRYPHTVQFDGDGSYDVQGGIASWKWKFGDGAEVETVVPSVTHVFEKPGIFVTQLSVTDDAGNESFLFVRERIYVSDDITPPLIAQPDDSTFAVCNPASEEILLDVPVASDGETSPTVTGQVISMNGTSLTPPIPVVDGRVILGIGAYTVEWTASDTVNESSVSQNVDVIPAVYAVQNMTVGTRSTADASVFGGTSLLMESDSRARGVLSNGNITLQDRVIVDGDGTAAGTIAIGSNSTVTGNVLEGVYTPVPPPLSVDTVVFPPPWRLRNFTIVSGQTRILSPGVYGQVNVTSGGTLVLTAGKYAFTGLQLDSQSVLNLCGASGPVQVVIGNTSALRGAVNTCDASLVVAYQGQWDMVVETSYHSTLIAPNATVQFEAGGGQTFGGQVFAKNIRFRPDVDFQCVGTSATH